MRWIHLFAFATACGSLLMITCLSTTAQEPARVGGTWVITRFLRGSAHKGRLTIQRDGATIKGRTIEDCGQGCPVTRSNSL